MKNITNLLIIPLLFSTMAQASDEHPGKAVFEEWCVACHGDDVAWSGGGTSALKVKYKGQIPAKLEDRTDLTAELVKYYVRTGLNGMPTFRHVEINDKQLDALADYLAKLK